MLLHLEGYRRYHWQSEANVSHSVCNFHYEDSVSYSHSSLGSNAASIGTDRAHSYSVSGEDGSDSVSNANM